MNKEVSVNTNGCFPVSVVLATYNGEQFLEQQLESIFGQTILPDEIIIVDDQSTDQTLACIQKISTNIPVHFYQNEKRLGFVGNFKRGVALAKPNNYIALCDQDDIWLPEKLEKSIQLLSEIDDGKTPALIYSDLILVDSEENILNTSFHHEMRNDKYIHNLQTILYTNFVTGCTVMMNSAMRNCFADIPVNQTYFHDAWIGLIGCSFGKIAKLDRAYILYRKHQTNASIANFNKSNLFKRSLGYLKLVFIKKNFMEREISLAADFYKIYQARLPKEQQKLFLRLIQLKGQPFVLKKILFEISFFKHWIKRF